MTKNKLSVAVTSKAFSKNELLVTELEKHFQTIKLQRGSKNLTSEELVDFLQDMDYAIIGLEKINTAVLSRCPNLKGISKYGVGLDNINQQDCLKNGVKVGWTAGVNKLSVAEMTLGFMLGLSRNLFTTSGKLQDGIWHKDGGFQLSNKTVGIIGCGHIGKEVIRLLKPFNCTILVNDIVEQNSYYIENDLTPCSKEDIYKNCDFITIHTPLDESTRNLINIKVFEQMKRTAFMINSARGGIINENDLITAIDENLIAGAALDTYDNEPLEIEELYGNEKIICTPHIGGNSKEAIEGMGYSAINNLLNIIRN